jgi:hypothetical protein
MYDALLGGKFFAGSTARHLCPVCGQTGNNPGKLIQMSSL